MLATLVDFCFFSVLKFYFFLQEEAKEKDKAANKEPEENKEKEAAK